MKTFITLIILLSVLFASNAEAQLTGVKTVKATGGNYSTLTAAITDLNTNGVGIGGVTFNVEAGFTENITAPLLITATGTSLNLITFQKDPTTTGDNPKITRTDAGSKATTGLGGDGDAIIQLNGSDYMIFNGIDVQSGNSTIEYGYYTYKPSGTDGCQNVIIKNSTVTMIKSTAYNVVIGIHISNGPTALTASTNGGVTVTDYSGRNENIEVSNNLIQNVNQGIYVQGYNHTVSPYDFYDQNVTIGKAGAGNTIQNFQWASTSGSCYGIYSSFCNNFNASYNYLNNTAGGGAASTSFFYAIYSSYTKAATITYSYNTFNLTTTGTRAAYAFGNNAGDVSSTFNVHHNTLENCVHGSSGVFSAFNNGVTGITLNLYSNTVRNNTINAGSSAMFTLGSVDTAYVYDNIVSNNTITGGTSTNSAFTISGSGVVNMYRNSISGYTSTVAAPVYAISISGGKEVKVYNNLIYDIKTIYSNATTDAIRGISITSTTATSNIGIYYNTIYLDASTGGADFWTSCVFHTFNTTATTASLDMRNNILVNATTPSGVGKTNAFRRSASTDLNNYSALSNNNLFYSGTPGASNLIYYDGTNSYQTLTDFKTAVGPIRDAVSVTELPPFVNVSISPYDLHINSAITTQCESGGMNVPTITDDFEGNIRQGNPGYLGTGTAPDIGAYEFQFGVLIPELISPLNNSVNIPISLSLIWHKPQFANLYNILIARDSAFTNIIVNDSTLTDSIKTVSGLSNITTYYWKVRAKNGSAWSSFSSVWNFTTIPNSPSGIVLLSPANNATNQPYTNLTFIWSKAIETKMKKDNNGKTSPLTISNYWFEIAKDAGFTTGVIIDSLLTDTTKIMATLTSNINYWWRVKAKNQTGWGAFTSSFTFKTTLDPTFLTQANFTSVMTPQIMSGGGSIAGGTSRLPIVIRATVSNLTPNKLYRFYNGGAIYTDLGTGAYGAGNSMYINPDSLNNRYTTSVSLTTLGGYDVFRADGSGNCTRWFSFIGTGNATRFVAGKYVMPSIVIGDSLGVLIARYALNDSIKVVNMSSTNADTTGTGIYGISVAFPKNIVSLYDNATGTGKPLTLTYLEDEGVAVASSAPWYITNVNAQNGRWGTVIPNINANGVRRVEQRDKITGNLMTFNTSAAGLWPSGVNTVNPTGGITTPLALLLTDAPLLDYATLVSPANNATNQAVNLSLSWNAITYSSSYRVQLASDSLFTTIVKDSTGLAAISLPVTGLLNNQSYWWRVAGITTTGAAPFGTAFKFTTIPNAPNVPTLLSPANGSLGNSLNLSLVWTKPALSTGYNVVLATDAGFTTIVLNDSTLTDSIRTLTNLTPLTTYYWKVRAKNAGGWSSFSSAFNFKTVGSASQVTLSTPPNNATGQPTTVTFKWFKAIDLTDIKSTTKGKKENLDGPMVVSNYWFELSTDSLFATLVVRDTTLTDTTKTVSTLLNNTKYFWRVKGKNQIGWGLFSSTFNLFTMPGTPVLSTPANNSTGISLTPALTWLTVTGATSYRVQVSTDSLFVTTQWDTTGVAALTVTVPAGKLLQTTKYYWRVNATGTGGTGLYSTIWNFTTLTQSLSLNLKVYLEGFWDGSTQVSDTTMVYLASATTPYAYVDSAKVVLTGAGTASMNFNRVTTGSYYIVVNHRNHLETWSKLPQAFVGGTPLSYDFTTAMTQAYGDNMKQVGSVWVLFGGDANRDGSVDATDIGILVVEFGNLGYLSCDFNGDGDVNASDVLIISNNFGLIKITPGVEPLSPETLKTRKAEIENAVKTYNSTKDNKKKSK